MARSLLLLASLLPGAALAQVSVNSGALDRLQPAASTAAQAPGKPAERATAHRPAHPAKPGPAHPAQSHAAPAHTAPPNSRALKLRPGLPPTVAPAPPSAVVLPPPVVAPTRPIPPPAPVPAVPDASGAVVPIKGGVRITFGADGSAMNPATEAAIRSFADSVKADATVDLNLYAFATGMPDDPSTPRRLSLARALAVRAVLIGQGIVSTRIYPRALGAAPSPAGIDGPPDRVDLMLANTPAATP